MGNLVCYLVTVSVSVCSIKKTLTSSWIKFLIVNEKLNTLEVNVKIKCHKNDF